MLIEIKNRLSGNVLFKIETEKLKLAVEDAVKSRAKLSGADLSGADLYGAKGIKDILQIGPIGSRKSYLMAIKNDKDEVEICAGCWSGSIEDFKAKVKEVHGDNQFGKDYELAIKLIESRLK